MEVTRTRNDLELWLTGTYAIWAQFFAGLYLRDPEAAQKHPFYIGALPKTGETARAEKEMLSESWDINSYKDLLETVEYMSEGPGYQNCDSQAGLAWELCRSMQLLGCAYLIGWCSREECIRRSCAVGRIMQKGPLLDHPPPGGQPLQPALEYGAESGQSLRAGEESK